MLVCSTPQDLYEYILQLYMIHDEGIGFVFFLPRCDTLHDWNSNLDSHYNNMGSPVPDKSSGMGDHCRQNIIPHS